MQPAGGRNALLLPAGFCVVVFLFYLYAHRNGGGSHLLSQFAESTAKTTASSSYNTDLIMYSYHETEEAKINFVFFLAHALHASADFILMLNGAHTVAPLLAKFTPTTHPNIRIIERENTCFDLGGFHEILTFNPNIVNLYKRFIFMNASLRGPFFPPWANETCWSDAYWAPLQDTDAYGRREGGTKLVGMTWNCANGIPYPPHLQSMILAFSQTTLKKTVLPHMQCYEDMPAAIGGETGLTGKILDAGGEVFAMNSRFMSHAGPSGKDAGRFLDWCVDEGEGKVGRNWTGGNDVLHSGNWEGGSVHPYETIFAKTNRDWDERDRRMINILTEHADLQGYSSYDRC